MTRFEEMAKAYSLEYFGKPLMEADEEGVEGIDVLGDQESAISEDPADSTSPDTGKIILLTNILLQSAKFKPSDEVVAYLAMPRFLKLSAFSKITAIRNLLSDHPELIVQEAEGDEGLPVDEETPPSEEAEVADFGEADIELDEASEAELLNLILRVLVMDPYSLPSTLRALPAQATEDNYQQIIAELEAILV